MPAEKIEEGTTDELRKIVAVPTSNCDIALAKQEEASYEEGGAPDPVLSHARLQHELTKLDLAEKELNLQYDAKMNALDREREEVRGIKQDINARESYSNKIFRLITCWLIFIGFYLILTGRQYIKTSDDVILAVLGGTTVNVLGLFLVVVNYLFPKK